MKNDEEKLRELLRAHARQEKSALGEHLRDADFIRLIESAPAAQTEFSTETGGASPGAVDDSAPLRLHLAGCVSCLAEFKDFYAFYAPAQENEALAGKNEIAAAWHEFAPRIVEQKPLIVEEKPNFWARLFPGARKTNYAGALGWGFAALLLLSSIVSIFIAYDAKNENSQLAAQIENQKRISEERLKTLEQSAQNSNIAGQEKTALTAEKEELRRQIAKLQTDLERARQPIAAGDLTPARNSSANSPPAADNSLIAVNTPIYDVFPADAAVRGGGESAKNNLIVPKDAESIVLILNAAGSAEFQTYRAELFSSSGTRLWRGADLKKDSLGNFTFTISRAALKPGNYRLKLFGKNNGEPSQPVTEYALSFSAK